MSDDELNAIVTELVNWAHDWKPGWLAQDSDGAWMVYRTKPVAYTSNFNHWNNEDPKDGRINNYRTVCQGPSNPLWQHTLVKLD